MITNKLKKGNGIKRIVLFILTLALTNCQHEENMTEQSKSSIQTVSITEAKSFLTRSQNSPSGKLYRSQLENFELDKIVQEKMINTDQLLTVIPVKRINAVQFDRVLLLKIDNVIKSVVYKMYSDGPQITSPFSGKILIYDLDGNFINGFHLENGRATLQYIKKSSKSITSKSSSDEYGGELEGVTVINRYKNNRFIPEIADFGWGDNLGGGNGGGDVSWEQDPGAGNSGGSDLETTEDLPPSCQSFNFSKTASLWQTALVKNISFNIILLDETGVTFMHSAKFVQPISFGMPTNHAVGGAPISSGAAAELSAQALQTTIREVVAKYGRVKVPEMIVEQYFKERLLYNYPLFTSGGRVNWTTTENLPVTDYQTTFMLPDDCE